LQKEYVELVEEKVGGLDVVDGEGIRIVVQNTAEDDPKKKKKKRKNDDKNEVASETTTVVVPTTEELMRYVHEPKALSKIESVQSDCLQRAEEKVAIAKQTYALVDNVCRRLDFDIRDMEKLLLATGEFQAPGVAKPNDLAAIQVPGSLDWILAKVISYVPETGMYKLSDEDVESNKIFDLPESQVVILGGLRNLRAGDVVYAVYPETTAFYKGTIAQAPRKVSGGGSFVMVSFLDDHDENGITHDKAVLLKHVMLPPGSHAGS